MIPFLFGIKTIKTQRQAFRPDYCLNCKRPVYSTLTRSMTFGAVFFIPVLPLGIRTQWLCDECGDKPHSLKRTRLPFKFAALILLVSTMWASFQATEGGSDQTVDGVLRVIIAGLIRCPGLAPGIFQLRSQPSFAGLAMSLLSSESAA